MLDTASNQANFEGNDTRLQKLYNIIKAAILSTAADGSRGTLVRHDCPLRINLHCTVVQGIIPIL